MSNYLRDFEGAAATKDRNAKILRSILAGEATMADLGRKYGLTRERIRQIANTGGMTGHSMKTWDARYREGRAVKQARKDQRTAQRTAQKAVHEERRATVIAMRESGLTQAAIAQKLGLSIMRINQILIQAGYRSLDMSNRNNPELYQKILRLRANGLTYRVIGAICKCSEMMAHRTVRRMASKL